MRAGMHACCAAAQLLIIIITIFGTLTLTLSDERHAMRKVCVQTSAHKAGHHARAAVGN
jgi:hypothetical protein